MIDNFWEYMNDNSATLITSYLGILLALYIRRKEAENAAINAYLANLGLYIENMMLPSPRYLAKMKMQFAKFYGVNIECFPIKQKAIRKILFLYRSNSDLILQRQCRLYQIIKSIKPRFIEYDCLVTGTAKDFLSWKQMTRDYSVAFTFVLLIIFLEIISFPDELTRSEILIIILVYAIFTLLTTLSASILFFIMYRIRKYISQTFLKRYFKIPK